MDLLNLCLSLAPSLPLKVCTIVKDLFKIHHTSIHHAIQVHSLASLIPPGVMANVASFSGISGLMENTLKALIYSRSQIPVIYLGNAYLSPPLPEAYPCRRGVSQYVPTYRFLWISLKTNRM